MLYRLSYHTYADDMAIAADNISDMQKGMDIITQWADDNELKINLKTQLNLLPFYFNQTYV